MNVSRSPFWSLAMTLGMCGVIYSQQHWQSVPYKDWTKEDIIKLASDSPWAQVKQATPNTAERIPAAYLPAVTIRLRSGLPIRQALLRLKQLEAKYDKMNDNERAEFDGRTKGLLECPPCADNYIVTLGPPISHHQMKNGLRTLVNTNLSLLEKRVFIENERGERRELIHFVAPKHDEDEAVFFFPRFNDKGNPLLTPESKKLFFIFEAQNLHTGAGLGLIPERFEFDVSKLVINGKVEF